MNQRLKTYISFIISLFFLSLISEVVWVEPAEAQLRWDEIQKGFEVATFELHKESPSLLSSEVILIRLSLEEYKLNLALSEDLVGKTQSDIQTLTRRMNAVAGINASFFSPDGKALGLVLTRRGLQRPMHKGGHLLTGLFILNEKTAKIVHRSEFSKEGVSLAVQSGPRLLAKGKKLSLTDVTSRTRRSGVAITKKGEVILYATRVRFPGATLVEIQNMLMLPELGITDALNFDGGGSSQLFVEKFGTLEAPLFVTGGDLIPVGLVVRNRK